MRYGPALGLTSALALAACSSSVAGSNTSSATTLPLSLSLSSGDLVPAFTEGVHAYELTSFTTLDEVSLTVNGRVAHVLGVTAEPGVPTVLPAVAITDTATLDVAFDAGPNGEAAATYTVKLRPADFPKYTFTSDRPEPGKVLLTTFPFLGTTPQPWLFTVDTRGELLYYQRKNDEISTDLKRHVLADGSVYVTYLSDGKAHLLDEHLVPIRDYTILETPKHIAWKADNHEMIVLGPDHVIIEGYVKETVTNIPADVLQRDGGVNVYASVIQEIDHGQVVFDWQSTDHPELYGMSTEANDFRVAAYADYSHLNSVVVDPSNANLVASFRHLDCVLEISRTDGSIVWRLGGTGDTFGTTAEQKSSHQHFASFLPDGRLMMYDNGVATSTTRILTFGLDAANQRLTSFESMPLDGYFSEFMGSTQPVGAGSLLVGLGTSRSGEPDVLLYDRASGRRSFSLTLDDDDYYSYRAHWEDGLAR